MAFRKQQLKKLKTSVKRHESAILEALYSDLGKPEFEAYGSEVGFFYNELNHTLKYLRDWMEQERPSTSFAHFPTRTRVHSMPKGQVLVLAPWNYPFMLVFDPLIAILAAGNTAVLKLPWQTPAISKVMNDIITETFDSSYVVCIAIDDQDIIPNLIEELRFDHIFFTGSTRVGKLIMGAAAKQLTPVTLELGGKSPAIVERSANLKLAARRIAWAKAFNAGQTCVAPDYVLVDAQVKEKFMALLRKEVQHFMKEYGGLQGFPKIVNRSRYDSLLSLVRDSNVTLEIDEAELKIGPCIVDEPAMESQLMQEEIFGPILPVVSYSDMDELKQIISKNPTPLSFYLFTNNKAIEHDLMQSIPFGGGCVNNCLIHLSNPEAPFGGVGNSGMGSYHGKVGFDTFSHKKTIMKTGTWIDPPLRYVPYEKWKVKILRLIFR